MSTTSIFGLRLGKPTMNSPPRSLKLLPPSFGPASETCNTWISFLRCASRRCYSIQDGRTTPRHGTHAHSIHEVYTIFLAPGPSHRQPKRPNAAIASNYRPKHRLAHTLDRESRKTGRVQLPLRSLVAAFRILTKNRPQIPKCVLGGCTTSAVTSSSSCSGPGVGLRS